MSTPKRDTNRFGLPKINNLLTQITNYMTKNQKRLHLIDFEGLTRCLRYNPNHI